MKRSSRSRTTQLALQNPQQSTRPGWKQISTIGMIPAGAGIMIILLFWLMGALPSLAQGEAVIRYVSPNGSGVACSPVSPCALQTAVNLSTNGDTVRAQLGVYASPGVTPVLELDDSIEVIGGYNVNYDEPPDPLVNPTILDGQNNGRVVAIVGAASPLIEGFTIRYGAGGDGAGIYNPQGTPTIRHNRIHDNVAAGTGRGGGIYDSGGATIEENLIYNNQANRGGGIALDIAVLEEIQGGTAQILFNEIYSNTATGSSNSGGGIYVGQTSAFLEGNTIHHNNANLGGGLATFLNSATTVQNNLFFDNSAVVDGGGLFLVNSVTLWNNTVAANSAGDQGGGIYVEFGSAGITNTIVASNTAGTANGGVHNATGTVVGGYNNLFNNDSNVTFPNEITGDPSFLNYPGRNLHLAGGSPNIDTADPNTPAFINIDIDGQSRPYPVDGEIDVGADEFYPAVPDFSLTPDLILDQVNRSSTREYTHHLENQGTVQDSYTFTCANDRGWAVNCPDPVDDVSPGDQVDVQTSVDVPDEPAFTVGTTQITATSAFSPDLQMVAVIQSTVRPMPDITFAPSYSDALRPEEMITFTHNLTNTGDYTDNIRVILLDDPGAWAQLLPSNDFDVRLAPGESRPVFVRITVPEEAPAGLANTVQIKATSQYTTSAFAIVSDTITAKATIGPRYVVPGGSDAENNCRNVANPCATVAHAVGQAAGGDAVNVAAGEYGESNIPLNDTIFVRGGWDTGFNAQGGPELTILDAGGNGRIFNIAPGVLPSLSNMTLRNADIASPGGAVFIGAGSQVQLTDLVFANNQASRGGAVYVSSGGLANVRRSSFYTNTAGVEGGAIYATNATLNVRQSRFQNNQANNTLDVSAGDGGAIYATGAGLLLVENNLFYANNAVHHGGALHFNGGAVSVRNNTLSTNNATGNGGGIYNGAPNTNVVNTILVSNTATEGGAIFNAAGSTTLSYSDVFGNSTDELVNVTQGTGNISDDPLLAGVNFRLPAGSPAVDRGDPNTPLAVDFEDDFRPSDQGYDIGWDELIGCRAKRGEDIFGSIQAAVDANIADDLIKVNGICRGVNTTIDDGQTISQTVHLTANLTIQGGWDVEFNAQGDGVAYIDPEGRGRGFWFSDGVSATLEALVVLNGDASGLGGGPAGQDAGGGIYNQGNSTFRRVSVFSSTAAIGGGFYNAAGNPTITAHDPAGAYPVQGDLLPLNPWNAGEFAFNTAQNGGGFYNQLGAPRLDGVIFHDNQAAAGGGMYNNAGQLRVENTVLYENTAVGNGGAVYNGVANATYLHLTVFSNTAGINGGGFYLQGNNPQIRSTIFQGNIAPGGPAVFAAAGGATLDYNYYYAHPAPVVVGTNPGANSIISNITPPGLEDPGSGDFHLTQEAAAKDQGDPQSPVTRDLDGEPRPADQTFDMGADEFAGCRVSVNGVIYGSIRLALANAEPGDVIRVSGICTGVQEMVDDGGGGGGTNECAEGGLIRASLILTKSVTLQGGWDQNFLQRNSRTFLDAQQEARVIYIAPNITPTVEGFDIINGFVSGPAGSGGGICVHNSLPTIQSNRLYSHTAANGAALFSKNGAPVVDSNRIYNNDGTNGAVQFKTSISREGDRLPALQNNFIYANTLVQGGGVYVVGGDNQIYHNNIAGNTAGTGGGLYVAAGDPDIRSNIVISNMASNTGGAFGAAGSTPFLDYNDFYSNTNGDFGGTITGDGPNGISADPQFANLASYYFTITFDSPVVDVGDPTLPVLLDFEGDLRPSHQAPDIGADEVGGCYARLLSEPEVIYGSVQLAINMAADGETVQMDGVCRGVNRVDIGGGTLVTQTLFINPSITLDGDWNYASPLSGTLDAGNAGRTLFVSSDAVVTVTGVLLQNGRGNSAGLVNGGGGVFNTGGLALLNSDLLNHQAHLGAAIYNEGHLHLRRVAVYTNAAGINGGGFYQAGGVAFVESSRFHNNIAGNGGGVYYAGGDLTLDGNWLSANNATNGAGIYLNGGTGNITDIWNNILFDNTANDGGGIYNNNTNGRIYHNTLVNNLGLVRGAGLLNAGGAPLLRNNIVDANVGAGLEATGGTVNSDYNNVISNTGGDYVGVTAGPHDISAIPDYVNFDDNNFHLWDGSPGVDIGDETLPVFSDIDRDVRPTNDAPDMGADEVATCLIRVGDRLFGVLQTAIDYAETEDIMTVEIARGECRGVDFRDGTYQSGYVSENLEFIGSLRRTDFSDPGDYYNIYINTVSSIINAEGNGRVIKVAPGAEPTFTHLAFVNGDASAQGGNGDGGGVYNPGSGFPQFLESMICQNSATDGGGYYGGSGSNAHFSGGGLGDCRAAQDIQDGDPPLYRNVFFDGNEAAADGGGYYFAAGAEWAVTNNGIDDNSAGDQGGGLYNAGDGRIINGIFIANRATNDGGGIYTSGPIEILHNTIRDNDALSGSGGGVFRSGSAAMMINSSVFYANSAAGGGGGIHSSAANVTNDYNNNFENIPVNFGGGLSEGPNSIERNPLLFSWLINRFSPNLDRADPALLEPPFEVDFDAGVDPRPDGNTIHRNPPIPHRSDIGADEYFKDFGCSVAPNLDVRTAVPGTTITYTFVITNEGWPPPPSLFNTGFTDTITVSLSSQTHNWPTMMRIEGISSTQEAITLDWRETIDVELTISVPPTATSGTQDTSVVRCRSAGMPERTKTGRAVTNVGLVSSILVEPDYVDQALPGDEITYTHYITNIGNQVDAFEVTSSAGPQGTTAFLSRVGSTPFSSTMTHTVTLAPGEMISVALRVRVLATAAGGEVATPGVIARSSTDPTIFGAALNRITIGFTNGTRHVAVTGDNFGNNCTDPQQPCATLQHAVDQALDHDTVLMAAGLYSGTVTRTIGAQVYAQLAFIDKSLTIRGGYDAIDEFSVSAPITNAVMLSGREGFNHHRVLFITDNVTVTLSSLFIQEGAAFSGSDGALINTGGGIYNAGANLTITGTWVLSNGARYGGGLYHVTGTLTVQNSVFAHNTNQPNPGGGGSNGEGGGIFILNGAALLENNTFVRNRADISDSAAAQATSGNGGALFLDTGSLTLLNTIFLSNTGTLGPAVFVSPTSSINNDFNLFFGHSGDPLNVPSGPNSFTGDPRFIDAFYHIGPNSAAKDAGTAAVTIVDGFDFEREPRVQGATIDIGADERRIRATFTFEPEMQMAVIEPGATHIYTHTLINTGDFTETYDLVMTNTSMPPGGGWAAALSPITITDLPPAGSVPVTVIITGSNLRGYQNTTIVTATSGSNVERQVVNITKIGHTAGVDIGPSLNGVGQPGQLLTYTHNLTNTGDGVDEFTLSIAAAVPGDWPVTVTPTETGFVAAGETIPFTVTVLIPDDANAGDNHLLVIQADAIDPVASDTLTNNTSVEAAYGVALEPDNSSIAAPGSMVNYTHILTNLGNLEDTFTLTVSSSQGWDVSVLPTSVILPPFGSTTVQVVVDVPADAAGETDVTTVTAESAGSGLTDTAVNTTTVTSAAGVLLDPDYTRTAAPGTTLAYQHWLTNTGSNTDTYTLTASSSEGWLDDYTMGPITLDAGMSAPVWVTVTIPAERLVEDIAQVDTTIITATSETDPAVFDIATDITGLAGERGVVIEPDNTGSGLPGASVVYQHTVTNTDNVPDEYTLAAFSAEGWNVAVAPDALTLEPGMSIGVVVTVSIPAGASPGTVDITTITATSVVSATVQDSAMDTTTVLAAAERDVDIAPDNFQVGMPGEFIDYYHLVTNTGTLSDSYSLTFTGTRGWALDVEPDVTPVLLPGQSTAVTVSVRIPLDADPGEEDNTLVTATSQADPAVADTATDTTRALQVHGLNFYPDRALTVPPDTDVVYQHTLENTGNGPDTFALVAVSSNGWTTNVASPIDLDPGMSTTVTVTLSVPAGTAGMADIMLVTATSTISPASSATVQDTTTVSQSGTLDVDIGPDNSATAYWNQVVTYQHWMTNTGLTTDTFSLSATSTQGWTVDVLPQNSGELPPGGSIQLEVQVTTPAYSGGPEAVQDVTTVTARADSDPVVFATAHNTTTIGALYMPILLKQTDSPPPPTPTPTPPPGPTPTPTPGPCVPTGVDLEVIDLWVEPAIPAGGQPATVFVMIKNHGPNHVSYGNNFYVDFYVDQVPAPFVPGDFDWGVQGSWMIAGAVRILSAEWTFSSGSHNLYAQIDTDNSVDECPNENNNIYGPVLIGVSGIDTGDEREDGTPLPPPRPEDPRDTPTPVPVDQEKEVPAPQPPDNGEWPPTATPTPPPPAGDEP